MPQQAYRPRNADYDEASGCGCVLFALLILFIGLMLFYVLARSYSLI